MLITAPPCFACSCVESSEAEKFENATTVFTGKVTDVEDASSDAEGGGARSWRIEVESVEKGGAAPMEYVLTGSEGDTCAPGFEIGERYQVYASRNRDGRLETNICAGTHALEGKAKPVEVERTPPPTQAPGATPTISPRRGELPPENGEDLVPEPAEETPAVNPHLATATGDGGDGANSLRDWTITILVWALLALPVVLLMGRRSQKTHDA